MKTIEAELHKLHDSIRSERTEPMDVDESNPAGETKLPAVFARIDRVDQGSPAERAVSTINDYFPSFIFAVGERCVVGSVCMTALRS